MSAQSTIVKTQFDRANVAIADGSTPTPKVFSTCAAQDINITDLTQAGRTQTAYQIRARVTSVRRGERVFPQIAFTTQWSSWTTTTGPGSIYDMIYGVTGSQFAGRVSTAPSLGDVPLFNVTITVEGTDYGDARDHVMLFQRCSIEAHTMAEGDPDTASFTLMCMGDVYMDGIKIFGDQAC